MSLTIRPIKVVAAACARSRLALRTQKPVAVRGRSEVAIEARAGVNAATKTARATKIAAIASGATFTVPANTDTGAP